MSGIRRIASPLPLPFSRATMAGGFLFLSGQIPYDAQGEVVRGSIQDQTHAASVRQGAAAGDGKIRASMNGRVVAVHVSVGDTVKAGQPVLTLEAMKMEHVHSAPIAGKVVSLAAAMGDQVSAFRVVAEIENPEAAKGEQA